jgi:Mn-dependent DtxR family transcriptional regulator
MTSDEKLMLKFYELAMLKGDPYKPVNAMKAAKLMGMKETALKTILKSLAQANFVKKIDDAMVCLTERGCEFVLSL